MLSEPSSDEVTKWLARHPGWRLASFSGICLYCQERFRTGEPVLEIHGRMLHFMGWCCAAKFTEYGESP